MNDTIVNDYFTFHGRSSVAFSNSAFMHINDYFIYDNIIILHTFKFLETSVYLYKYTTFVGIT